MICLNVIEHVPDDRAGARQHPQRRSRRGGRAIVLVPQGPWNFGTLDEVLGHRRRYTQESLRAAGRADAAFEVEQILPTSTGSGTLAWFLNGKILRRRTSAWSRSSCSTC